MSAPDPSPESPERDEVRPDPGDLPSTPAARLAKLGRQRPDAGSRYEVRGELGRGGMGLVYEVWDTDLRRALAMKVLRADADVKAGSSGSSENLVRFLEEAQITAQLDHPGVVPVHELGLDADGRVYFTMGRVKGRDLKGILQDLHARKGGWTLTRAVGVIHKVCETMAFAHAKGVLHRDLKPTNVMVGRFGAVYVMDWGLACVKGKEELAHDIRPRQSTEVSLTGLDTDRVAEAEDGVESPLVTMDGAVIGTPAYMAPEQARGELERVGPASDVYSVGAMLYQALTGRTPYVAPGMRVSAHMLLALVITGPPEPVEQLARVPAELVAICEKAMARDPRERYASMTDLAADLAAYLEGRVVSAYETGAWAELKKWVARNRGLAVAGAVALLAAFGGLGLWIATQARHARERFLAADVYRYAYFLDRADELWPAAPELAGDMRAWVRDVEALLARREQHAERLDDLRARDPDSPEIAAEEALLAGLDELTAASPAVSVLADVRARLAFAETVQARTIDAAAELWAEARGAIAAHPAYGGLELTPQLGLVPLGPDPASGLWEFAHLASGSAPGRGADGRLALAPENGIVLVLIPGGEFRMGAEVGLSGPNRDLSAHGYEGPIHAVTLAPYLLAKHEMTQAQWRRAMHTVPSLYNPVSRMREKLTLGREWMHPVEYVSWQECDRVLRRLGLALPTEAQWERAARAGGGTRFQDGKDRETLIGAANLADAAAARDRAQWEEIQDWPELDDGYALHAPVDALRPNAYGLHHVHGNVLEWCSDWFVAYDAGAPRQGDGYRVAETEAAQAIFRIARGGSLRHGSKETRLSYRHYERPHYVNYYLGVRAARPLTVP
jgi:formylglycine-generating enzyme required for sulfatase activity/serine/threonine protein kinase